MIIYFYFFLGNAYEWHRRVLWKLSMAFGGVGHAVLTCYSPVSPEGRISAGTWWHIAIFMSIISSSSATPGLVFQRLMAFLGLWPWPELGIFGFQCLLRDASEPWPPQWAWGTVLFSSISPGTASSGTAFPSFDPNQGPKLEPWGCWPPLIGSFISQSVVFVVVPGPWLEGRVVVFNSAV